MAGDTGTMDEAVDRISGAIFGGDRMEEPSETPGVSEAIQEPAGNTTEAPTEPVRAQTPAVEAPKVYDPPKSWKKEMHEHWTKLDPTVQGYFVEREEQLLNGFKQFNPIKDALTPHLDYLNQRNIQAPYAVDSLLRAHRMLTEGPIEQRKAFYEQLGRNLQIIQEAQQEQAGQQPIDPMVQQLRQKLTSLEATLQERSQRELEEARATVKKEVDAFAADTKTHPYFEEVAAEIAIFVQQGMSLQDAYEKAVWANPTTRQKELTRVQTEHEAKIKENARLAALPKKKAAGVNVKSNGDGSAPTEPLGSLEDTIRSAHREIRQRAS